MPKRYGIIRLEIKDEQVQKQKNSNRQYKV